MPVPRTGNKLVDRALEELERKIANLSESATPRTPLPTTRRTVISSAARVSATTIFVGLGLTGAGSEAAPLQLKLHGASDVESSTAYRSGLALTTDGVKHAGGNIAVDSTTHLVYQGSRTSDKIHVTSLIRGFSIDRFGHVRAVHYLAPGTNGDVVTMVGGRPKWSPESISTPLTITSGIGVDVAVSGDTRTISLPPTYRMPQPGNVGTFLLQHVRKATQQRHVFTNAYSWVTKSSLAGATGPQGPRGLTGPQGPRGLTGPQGPAGPAGTGTSGLPTITSADNGKILTANGSVWTAGSPAIVNVSTGSALSSGSTPGSTIAVGGSVFRLHFAGGTGVTVSRSTVVSGSVRYQQVSINASGVTGPRGPRGFTGATGPAGPTGATGPAGPTGARGPAGPAGTTYTSGTGISISGTKINARVTPPIQIYDSYIGFNYNTAVNKMAGTGLRASGSTLNISSSDKRLKYNIRSIDDGLAYIRKINTVSFLWLEDEGFKVGTKSYGVIAQEIQKVLPELVTRRKDGKMYVHYPALHTLTLRAVQQNDTRIRKIESQVSKLIKEVLS